ncbi:Holliday junction resolvase Hjc [Candidatus Altiarchaeota archaeon]
MNDVTSMGARYKKGADFERRLVTEFWDNGWAAIRSAGSGTRKQPVPDVIAVKGSKVIACECKTTVKESFSLRDVLSQLNAFHEISGAQTYLAVKFPRKQPRFYKIEFLNRKSDKTIRQSEEYESLEMVIGGQDRL